MEAFLIRACHLLADLSFYISPDLAVAVHPATNLNPPLFSSSYGQPSLASLLQSAIPAMAIFSFYHALSLTFPTSAWHFFRASSWPFQP